MDDEITKRSGSSEARPRPRIEWVDIAKAMSIMLIVFMHATMFVDSTGANPYPLWWIHDTLSPIRVPLFFVASGLFARATATKDARRLYSRVLKLYWVFAVWVLLTHLYASFILGRPGSTKHPQIGDFFYH